MAGLRMFTSLSFRTRIEREARKIPGTRNYRHVALVFRGGNLKAIACNFSRHAEVAALSKLFPSERKGTTVLSLRVRADGSLANAKPCKACAEYLRINGVKKVSWSTSEGNVVKLNMRDF
jgi:cytidine deaminase